MRDTIYVTRFFLFLLLALALSMTNLLKVCVGTLSAEGEREALSFLSAAIAPLRERVRGGVYQRCQVATLQPGDTTIVLSPSSVSWPARNVPSAGAHSTI